MKLNAHGLPNLLKSTKVCKEAGSMKLWQLKESKLMAAGWGEKKQRKPVCMLSTNINPITSIGTVFRKSWDGKINDIPCPPQVTLYTKYMNDVDHSDQIRMQYLVARKGYCWWTYLFWFLVDLSISNALVNHKNVTILNFRMHLAKQLICNIKRK